MRCSSACRSPNARARIRADIERDGLNNWGRIPSWDCVQISISPNLPQHAGKTIARARRGARRTTRSTRCAIISSTTRARRACWSPRSRKTTSPRSCADRPRWSAPTAIASRPTGTASQGMPHPRFYGTFPRIIDRYVRERARAAAGSRDPQDDRRDREGAQAEGPRPAAAKAFAPTSRSSIRPISATARPMPIRTSIRAASGPT